MCRWFCLFYRRFSVTIFPSSSLQSFAACNGTQARSTLRKNCPHAEIRICKKHRSNFGSDSKITHICQCLLAAVRGKSAARRRSVPKRIERFRGAAVNFQKLTILRCRVNYRFGHPSCNSEKL